MDGVSRRRYRTLRVADCRRNRLQRLCRRNRDRSAVHSRGDCRRGSVGCVIDGRAWRRICNSNCLGARVSTRWNTEDGCRCNSRHRYFPHPEVVSVSDI